MLYFNNIHIEVNNQVLSSVREALPASQLKPNFTLDFNNIKKLRVLKSYTDHLTVLELSLDNLTADEVAVIVSGKASFKIDIISGSADDHENAQVSTNYFVVHDMFFPPSSEDHAQSALPLTEITLKLLSLTTTRLMQENNLGFLNWGSAVVDTSQMTPKDFLMRKLHSDFVETYGSSDHTNILAQTSADYKHGMFTMSTWTSDTTLDVKAAPSTGYMLEGENNFEILDNFFKYYPPFLTPFGWIIDDLPHSNEFTTRLAITNFYSTSSWDYSTVMTNMLTSKDQNAINNLSYFKLNLERSLPYFNNLKYELTNPLLQLVQSSVQVPTMVDATSLLKEVPVKTASRNALTEKVIKNPKVKKIYSFLSENDVAFQKAYLDKYRAQAPTYDRYSLENIAYKDFNILEGIRLNAGINEGEDIPRAGVGYNFEYTFERRKNPNNFLTLSQILSGEQNFEERTYKCSLKADYLMTNDHADSKNYITLEKSIVETLISSFASIAAPGSMLWNNFGPAPTNISKDYGDLTIKGTPEDIATYGGSLIDSGFRYVWGGAGPSFDCSGFVMTAVCAATGLARFGSIHNKGGFPKGSRAQYDWCRKYARAVSYDDVQAGDILFLSYTPSGTVQHVGIAKSKTEVYASSSGKGKASLCSQSKPCTGAVTQPRGSADKSLFWDRNLVGIFRIEGRGLSSSAIPGAGTGVFCEQIAKLESGTSGGYLAYNSGSGAQGAYQFIPSTSDAIRTALNIPNDSETWSPENQDKMCEYYENTIISSLQRHNLPVTLRNVYLSWQQGPTGARRILEAYESGTEITNQTMIDNMSSNMHTGTYTGVASYIEDYDKYLVTNGVDPAATYG